ncbi:alpha/beta hydrolase [Rubrolithibacter danxiaensis]|uniref:alpha/beta hydrolase n=1 Tax=Rubrolithibacter danxiaensis TaxID=3390805 RepID=UPI003BF82F1B
MTSYYYSFKCCLLLFLLIAGTYVNSFSQTVIPLYKGSIPNSIPTTDEEKSEINKDSVLIISKISRPQLSIYLPSKEKATGAGVIICPGGGYWVEAAGHEGADVARKFNESGIAAFVLKYRIPSDETMINREIGALQDAQRAIQLVRENSVKWGVNKNRIGIMGFSAGGHLASTAGTHFNKEYIANPKHTSLRPDFMILVYPVISFTDSIGHSGSAEQLLGKNPSPEKIKEYSNELQVTPKTPPTFLVHAKDDPLSVKNSLVFEKALKENQVPVELYLYEKGGHGYGMNNKTSSVKWMDLVKEWMIKMKYIPSKG